MSHPRFVWSPFLSTLAAIALIATPAQADLASNLQHAPGGAEGVITVSTAYEDWRYFLTRKPFSDVMAKLQKDLEPVFNKELGIDFRKELLPMLGTHLNLAFYPPNPALRGEFPALVVFDLRRTDGYPRLIQRLKATAAADKTKNSSKPNTGAFPCMEWSASKDLKPHPIWRCRAKPCCWAPKPR